MAVGLITVVSEGYGEEWSNTWGIQVGTSDIGGLTDAQMDMIISDAELSVDSTTPGADEEAFEGAISPLASLIAFHRLIQYTPVSIARIYVSDGQKNPGSSAFFTKELHYPCVRGLGPTGTADQVVPLSLAWLINRNPNTYSQKAGRLYLRGAIADGDVRPGTRVGVSWTSNSIAAQYATLLSSVVADSLLSNWFGEPPGDTQRMIGIPNYGNTELTKGEVVAVQQIANLSSNAPKSRQMTRGRRRRTTTDGGD